MTVPATAGRALSDKCLFERLLKKIVLLLLDAFSVGRLVGRFGRFDHLNPQTLQLGWRFVTKQSDRSIRDGFRNQLFRKTVQATPAARIVLQSLVASARVSRPILAA